MDGEVFTLRLRQAQVEAAVVLSHPVLAKVPASKTFSGEKSRPQTSCTPTQGQNVKYCR